MIKRGAPKNTRKMIYRPTPTTFYWLSACVAVTVFCVETANALPVAKPSGDAGKDSAHQKKPNLPTIESPLARVELDSYLRNKRAMQLQIKCVVYDGPCDIVGKEVKKYIVVGLSGKCSDCSPRLKTAVEKVAHHIQENYPQAWYDAIYKYLVAPTLGDSYKTEPEEDFTVEPEEVDES